ncbi:hypothetical protein KI387_025757, partial [Taxus chinensis]
MLRVMRNPFSLCKRKPKKLNENEEQQQNISDSELPDDHIEELQEMEEVQGSSEVLVRLPRAVVHLVDGSEENVELGSGEFSLIRLLQGDIGLAILVKVGDDLSWPLTKDEPIVKVDSCHYLFSVRPPDVEEEISETVKSGSASGSEMLNYGVTFEGEEGLDLLDECLEHHACFSVPKDGGKLSSDRGNSGGAYWADLAPVVEDYNSMLAKAIASGTGQIIKGLFRCSSAYSSQVQKGGEFVTSRTKGKSKPSEVKAKKRSQLSPKRNIKRVRNMSRMTEKMSENVLKGVITVSGAVTGSVITSKPGKQFFSMLPGEVLLASLDAMNKVLEAVEVAGREALSTTSGVTTGIIRHRFGGGAGEVTQD